jgi:GT2 family glycosyltransferase
MLERCLDSLRLSTWKSFSVTVVDNGAAESDTQGLEASYPEVTVLCMPVNAGYAGGCNEGLKQTESDYVVFLNDDTVVDPCWLDHLVAAAGKDEGIGALQPKILSLRAQRRGEKLFDYAGAAGGLIDRLGYPFCLGRNFSGVEEDRGQYDREEEIFWASGVAMFASRAMVERAGGFDADFFMHMEEIDLCWRMKLLGNRICSVRLSGRGVERRSTTTTATTSRCS